MITDVTLDTSHFLMCIRGGSGIGKTYLCGQLFSIPEACPVLWIDVDGSSETILSPTYHRQFSIQNPLPGRIVSVSQTSDIETLCKAIAHGTTELKPRTLVIDNLTELQNRVLRELIVSDPGQKGRVDPELSSRLDYHVSQSAILRILRLCRYQMTNCDVICTSDERIMEDKVTGGHLYTMGLTPSLATDASRLFTVIARLTVNPRGERILTTKPSFNVTGLRDRLQSIAPTIENPNMATIYKSLKGGDAR